MKGWLSDFFDVPQAYLYHAAIEKIVRARSPRDAAAGKYCPSDPVTRDAMAKFILGASTGGVYNPTAATGTVFCGRDDPDAVRQVDGASSKTEGISTGCRRGGGTPAYCPTATVTRDAMSKFLLLAKHGSIVQPAGGDGDGVRRREDEYVPGEVDGGTDDEKRSRGAAGRPTESRYVLPDGSRDRGEMAKFLRVDVRARSLEEIRRRGHRVRIDSAGRRLLFGPADTRPQTRSRREPSSMRTQHARTPARAGESARRRLPRIVTAEPGAVSFRLRRRLAAAESNGLSHLARPRRYALPLPVQTTGDLYVRNPIRLVVECVSAPFGTPSGPVLAPALRTLKTPKEVRLRMPSRSAGRAARIMRSSASACSRSRARSQRRRSFRSPIASSTGAPTSSCAASSSPATRSEAPDGWPETVTDDPAAPRLEGRAARAISCSTRRAATLPDGRFFKLWGRPEYARRRRGRRLRDRARGRRLPDGRDAARQVHGRRGRERPALRRSGSDDRRPSRRGRRDAGEPRVPSVRTRRRRRRAARDPPPRTGGGARRRRIRSTRRAALASFLDFLDAGGLGASAAGEDAGRRSDSGRAHGAPQGDGAPLGHASTTASGATTTARRPPGPSTARPT